MCGGGGGQHYKPSVVGGEVDFEIKIWRGGGRRRNDGFTKKLPSPAHPPPPQLINNDWPLNSVFQISVKTTLSAVFFEKLPLFTALLILTTLNIE